MNRAAIARRLEKLEVLAARSPFPDEREAAKAKVKELREMLGMAPSRATENRRVRYVDVGEAGSIKDAFKKAFSAAFEDIMEMRRQDR